MDQDLNEAQKCAVISQSPVLQILAPPGSGKTKTLTSRVAHLIRQGFQPWNMIVCTFTIKAAREMRERIKSFVGEELQSKLILGTFHSVAKRYLTFYGHHIGIERNFGIADERDASSIITKLIKKHGYQMEPKVARSRISKRKSGAGEEKPTKSKGLSAEKQLEKQEFDQIFDKYQKHLRELNLLDFDDLLVRCVELLTRHPECVANIQAVLIDEFQDTNNIQYELMSLFAQKTKRERGDPVLITVVGDPDQSIYGWRNAEIGNLTKMQEHYTDHQIVNLEDNYRSAGAILKASMAVIEQDDGRHSKSMKATHCYGSRPVIKTLENQIEEAKWMVGEIQRLTALSAGLLDYRDFSILLRSFFLSAAIEFELLKENVPYKMVGSRKFFEKAEIRILVDYLRVIVNTNNVEALIRVVNIPSRKIGTESLNKITAEAEKLDCSLWQMIKNVVTGKKKIDKISEQAMKGLEQFYGVIMTLQEKLNRLTEVDSIEDLVNHLIQKLSFERYVKKLYEKEEKNKTEDGNPLEFVNEFRKLAAMAAINDSDIEEPLVELDNISQQEMISGPAAVLNSFLANFALATDPQNEKENANRLVISTIHAAKGLEWPVVFMASAYDGIIPHSRAENVDEERRLLFVGMTRAKSLLYLSRPQKTRALDRSELDTKQCPFLESQAVRDLCTIQGPSMTISVVHDIADILRRPRPDAQLLREMFSDLGYTEDPVSKWDLNFVTDKSARGYDFSDTRKCYPGDNETYVDEYDYEPDGIRQQIPATNPQAKLAVKVDHLAHASFGSARALPRVEPTQEIPNKNSKQPSVSLDRGQPPKKSKPTKPLKVNQSSLVDFFKSKTTQESTKLSSSTITSFIQASTTMSTMSEKSFRPALTMISNVPTYPDRQIRAAPLKRSRSDVEIEELEAIREKHILMSSSPPRPDSRQGDGVQERTETLFSVATTMGRVEMQSTAPRKYRLGTSRSYR